MKSVFVALALRGMWVRRVEGGFVLPDYLVVLVGGQGVRIHASENQSVLVCPHSVSQCNFVLGCEK